MTFRQYLFRLKWRFGLFILMYGVMIAALTAVSVFTGNMITALTQFKVNAFVTAAIVMVVATILQLVMQTLVNIYQISLQRRLNNDIRTEITKSIATMPFEQYHSRSDAVYTSWMTNDVNTINTQGLRNVGYLIQASWQVVLSIFVLLTYHASLFVTTLVCAVLLITVPMIYRKKLSAAAATWSQENEKLTNRLTDILEGFNTLFMANRRHVMVERVQQASDDAGHAQVGYIQFNMATQFLINLVNLGSQLFLLIQAGLLAYNHIIPVGAVVTIHSVAGTTFSGLTLMSFALTTVKSVAPIFDKFAKAAPAPQKAKAPVTPLTDAIKLQNVTFTYPHKKEPVINDLSMTLQANQKVALVGPSGRGKTTLLRLISDVLADYRGEITWDGQDYRQLDSHSLRDQITYIEQAPYIFNDTLRFNLTLGRQVDDNVLQQAIKGAQLTEFMKHQAQGLDTVLEHNGGDLSGGQKQRIALARGLIRHSRLIISDEGTAALDAKAGISIEKLLVSLPKTTLIMVTHNLRREIKDQLDRVITV
ncbi:ABC transporter ATP-binding protein [Lacticaseibacillus zeae]|uniref:ABC transporter ATP-binding protein n=1 Tax=Lacticaseibacillus zeae subsp. silagei TaxID=3068307 RepID=A0ABD7Z8G2_LACZE|nr:MULTISPECIES: ABC transporter ATP-binding protein [Lacticaseibacillus]MDE3316499.1 ABC transporter ATP-binding protein/permease [Lacticaseibacillus zeae]OFR96830.1 ABC transporter permease [Lactobacillus sp. HMSC068F07]WLV83298.1 ABC transporter ATP-binding protein [Lacticaseibacillus sp. NCIMB 15475]WLV86046.1 ABC transporter ATP-binding protein [Lacticaseibacillus sp. NCIMB 15474]